MPRPYVKGKMSLLRLAYVIALRRIVSSWRLEVVLFLGIVMAVALMSSGVVFSDLLAEAALRRSLDDSDPEQANFSVRVYNGLDDPAKVSSRRPSVYRSSLDFVDQHVTTPFQPYLQDQSYLVETSTFFFHGHSQLELDSDERPRGKIKYMTGFVRDRIQVDQGSWPYGGADSGSLSPPDEALEVAIDALGAELLQLGVGDEMKVYPAAGVTDPESITVKIVAIFRRVDPTDEFWYGSNQAFSSQDDRWTFIPLFTTEDAILERVGRAYPGLYTDVTWFFYLDRHGLRTDEVGLIQDAIRLARHEVASNLDHSSIAVSLDRILRDHNDQLMLARIPLFLMVFLVTGILIYYLALVTGLIVRSRSAEISMLKSRGSTTFQIGLLALVEGLVLALPAVALGPFLALGVAKALGRLFFDVGEGGGSVPVVLSSEAYLLGVAGAALALAVFTISTLVAARHGIVEFRQVGARPPGVPFIHRYYLDILALALVWPGWLGTPPGLIWWQIQSRGSFLVRSLGTGELELDYFLLIGPVLALLALGLVVMRFFPIAVTLLARVMEPLGPAWLAQGLRRVSRDPIIPGTLVVLLILATALGVIGSAFSSTLEHSQRDRALYAAGADLRIQHNGDRTPISLLGVSKLAQEVDGVERAVEVERTNGSLLTSGFSTASVTLLAVDSENFADVAWHRSDFAPGKSPRELASALAPSPSPSLNGQSPSAGSGQAFPQEEEYVLDQADGIILPQDATALTLWVRPDRPDNVSFLIARFQDARGYYFDSIIGNLDFKDWRRLEAEIVPLPPRGGLFRRFQNTPPPVLELPLTLISIIVSAPFGIEEPGVLFLGEFAAVTPEREAVLADFRTPEGWRVVEDYSRPGLYDLKTSESVAPPGADTSVFFSWAPGGIGGLRSIRPGRPEGPIPAVVSKSLLDEAEAHLGDTLILGLSATSVPIRVAAVADYFPTLYPTEEPFAVVDLRTFTHYTNLHNQRPLGGSNELWVSLEDGYACPEPCRGDGLDATPGDIIEVLEDRGINVRESHIASEMVSERVEQPLVSAGWGGLLVLMFLTLVLANASGVMLFFYLDTRERQTEFALLRTLGFSKWQLNGVVWFNLFLVVVCGIGLGTLAGQQIGSSLLPILEVAEEGVRVTPPMTLQTNWLTLLVSYLVLAGVTAITVVWLAWLTGKLEVQRVLRIGEA